MTTISDALIGFWKNYIAPTKEEVKKGRKELKVLVQDSRWDYSVNTLERSKLSVKECRQTAEQCPLFMKGARKKAMDSVRAWFRLESTTAMKKPAQIDLNIIRDFETRNQLKRKWYEARVASYVSGNGYLLITFDNDKDTDISEAPAEGAIPWKVDVVNSENITEIAYHPKHKEYYKKRFIKHFHYVDNQNNIDVWIHPDRIIHLPNNKLYNKELGNSTVNLLRNIIKSIINVDIACGEILAWFAHGAYDIKQDGLEEEERKKWELIAKKHPGAWIHDETAEITAIHPQAIDPKPFYDFLTLKVAAAFRIPTHVLTGIQVGRVTGAEVGMGDYVKDVKDDQDLLYSPLLERLYTMLLRSKGRAWKYSIVWNPIYIDELSEANILEKRVTAAELALNGVKGVGGFITLKEARLMFNKGQIEIDPDVIPVSPKPPKPPQKPSDTEDESEESENSGLYYTQLDTATKAMIQARKEIAEKERELGKKILEEQDDTDSK